MKKARRRLVSDNVSGVSNAFIAKEFLSVSLPFLLLPLSFCSLVHRRGVYSDSSDLHNLQRRNLSDLNT